MYVITCSYYGTQRVYRRNDLNKLEYVGMCIKESLRLYPPVYGIGREMSQNVTFDGHVMPKGASYNRKLYIDNFIWFSLG